MQISVFRHSSPNLGHNTLGRIERVSQNPRRRWSRSNHCLANSSSNDGVDDPLISTLKTVKRQGKKFVICLKSRCSGVIVWSVMVIQSIFFDSYRKATSVSFVALERSTEAESDPARNDGKLLVRMWVRNGRTTRDTSDVEEFQGERALLH